MSYKVVKDFTDLQDEGYIYKKGDVYPREGYEPTQNRINHLLGDSNRQKSPLIKSEDGLNFASSAQPEKVEQEAIPQIATEAVEEKPKRPRKKSN